MKAALILGFFASIFVSTEAGWAKNLTRAERDADFYTRLVSLQKDHLSMNPSSSQIGAAELSLGSQDPEISFPAILQLWLLDRIDTVELLWWQKYDRATRMFCASLVYCVTSEVYDTAPRFDTGAKRFVAAERSEREEEVKFVNDHLSSIAGLIRKGLECSVKGDAKSKAAALAPFIAKEKLQLGAPFDENSPKLINSWLLREENTGKRR